MVLRLVWRGFFVLLLLAGLGLALIFGAFSHLENYRQPLQDWLSRVLDGEARIGGVSTAWRDWQPSLRLERVALWDGENDEHRLEIERVYLDLELVASLLRGRLISREIELEGLRLKLSADPGPQASPGEREDPPDYQGLLAWLLAQESVRLENTRLGLRNATGKIAWLDFSLLRLYRQADRHYFEMELKPPAGPLSWPLAEVGKFGLQGGHLRLRGESRWEQTRLRGLRADIGFTDGRLRVGEHWSDWENLRGQLELARRDDGRLEGDFRLDSGPVDYRNAELFSHPLRLNHLSARLGWDYAWQGRAWHFSLSEGRAASPDIARIVLRGDLWLPDSADGAPPEVDLRINFQDAPLARVAHYVPDRRAGPEAMNWMRRGLVGGRVVRGEYLLRGPLFDPELTLSRLRAEVEDARIHYKPDWPPLSRVKAEVELAGSRLQVRAEAGTIVHNRLRETEVIIPDITAKRPWLRVDGAVFGPLDNGLRFIRESPLDRQINVGQHELAFDGEALVALNLGIPLGSGRETRVAGRIEFQGNSLREKSLKLRLDNIRGRLEFDDEHLLADQLPVTLFGEPARFSLSRQDGGVTRAQLDGQANRHFIERLLRHFLPDFEYFHWLRELEGETPWRAVFDIENRPDGERIMDLRLTAKLRGMAVHLPAPLRKPAALARPFSLRVRLDDQAERLFEIDYGDKLRALLAGGPRGFRRALHFGRAGQPRLPAQPGFRLSGHLDELLLSNWRPYFTGPPAESPSGPASADLHGDVNLNIKRLELAGLGFHDLDLKAELRPGQWSLEVEAREIEQGRLHYFPGRQRLTAVCEKLALPASPTRGGPVLGARSEQPEQAFWPSVEFQCDHLSSGNLELGAIELQSRREAEQWRLNRLHLENEDLTLEADGKWENTLLGPFFQINGNLRGERFGAMLKRLGYSGGELLRGAPTLAEFEGRWPGGPGDFSLKTLRAHLNLELGKGQLMDVEPGVGRVFGLFDLQTVPHRLALDFRDVFAEGLGFNRIAGKFFVQGGYAYTDRLLLDGPAAHVEIAGRTGLLTQTYDQTMWVVPHASNALPVAGALVGGLGLGAAVLVAQTLLQDEIEQGLLYRYTITGPWQDPVVKEMESPENN